MKPVRTLSELFPGRYVTFATIESKPLKEPARLLKETRMEAGNGWRRAAAVFPRKRPLSAPAYTTLASHMASDSRALRASSGGRTRICCRRRATQPSPRKSQAR